MGDTLAGRLRALGTRGVLLQMAQRGQIIELRCEMPKCYCHKGRGYFEPRSTPLPAWAPSPDHYPRLKADGGHLVPWNVRLSHVLCNREDYGWRMRIRRMLEKGMSLEEIAENLNHKRIRRPPWQRFVVSGQCPESVRLLATEPILEQEPAPLAPLYVAPTNRLSYQ
jgi:hypothetical protein